MICARVRAGAQAGSAAQNRQVIAPPGRARSRWVIGPGPGPGAQSVRGGPGVAAASGRHRAWLVYLAALAIGVLSDWLAAGGTAGLFADSGALLRCLQR